MNFDEYAQTAVGLINAQVETLEDVRAFFGAESWQAAGSQFKQAVTSEQWTQQGANVAAQLGAFQRRELQDAQHTTELPNAPAGEYMVLTYSSAFANLPNAREVAILQLEEGEWKVVGYFVQPAQG